MIIDFGLFFLGISGLIVLYAVLLHLSARMGEGMDIPRYYLLYYPAVFALILTIPVGWSIHYNGKNEFEDNLFTLLTIGNVIAIVASFKYWWWLKSEILGKKEQGR